MKEGPALTEKSGRENLLMGSRDVISADKVGTMVLGYNPSEIPLSGADGPGSRQTR